MKTFNGIIMGLLIGMGLGLWFGVNIGREVDIFSNPFVEPDLGDRISNKASELYEEGRKTIDKELNQ
ncbi:hypothetical protein [Sulfuriflexus mobilis]|uniref:hypothetical protein n=1 Tax=Sulfuriflexus mobilis TaxID=1811807 RepID=UPI000F81A3CD|nr:hypothetical protein [Sulfuriflexus mobilis]